MLAADIVNGGPLPAVLKDVAKGSGADMTSGLAIVRAVLQDFSKQNDQTLTMMADQFREWPQWNFKQNLQAKQARKAEKTQNDAKKASKSNSLKGSGER